MALSRAQEDSIKLSRAQEDSIKFAIQHLLKFPTDNKLFLLKEAGVMSALTTDVTDDHEFYYLGECLKNPAYYFQGLENQGSEATIGAIQDFMLELVEKNLANTGNALSCWNQEKVLAFLPEENRQKPFKSEKAFVDEGDNPHQLPDLPDKNYTQVFRSKNTKYGKVQSYIDVTVFIPAFLITKKQSIKLGKLRTDFKDDNEEDDYMEKILEEAADEAHYAATTMTLNALKKKKIIKKKIFNEFMNTEFNVEIITHRYWSNLLFLRGLSFQKVFQLTDAQNENLSEPSLIDLHKNRVLTFDEIKSLNLAARLIIKNPAYYPSIKNKTLKLDKLLNISERRAKLLVHPHMIRLIQNNKITFTEAKYLPYHLKPILISPSYLPFFQKNTVDWNEFEKIKATHCDMMLKPYMVCLISNKILTLQNLTSAMNMYPAPDNTFFQLLATASAKRLYRICFKRPSRINSTIDTFDHVMAELPHIAAACNKDTGVFKERTLVKFLAFLDMKVKKNIQALMPDDPRIVIYHNMQKIIQKSHGSKNKPQTVLDELHEFAVETLKSIPASEGNNSVTSYTITFYLKKRKAPSFDTDVKDFCDAVIALAQSTQNQSVLTKTIVRKK